MVSPALLLCGFVFLLASLFSFVFCFGYRGDGSGVGTAVVRGGAQVVDHHAAMRLLPQ